MSLKIVLWLKNSLLSKRGISDAAFQLKIRARFANLPRGPLASGFLIDEGVLLPQSLDSLP